MPEVLLDKASRRIVRKYQGELPRWRRLASTLLLQGGTKEAARLCYGIQQIERVLESLLDRQC